MKCEHCHKADANVHVQQTINGETLELHLCSGCASELGVGQIGLAGFWGEDSKGKQSAAEQLWSQFFGIGTPAHQVGGLKTFGDRSRARTRQETQRCPKCGMTLSAFAKSSFLGCSQCYETFSEALDVMLKRMQAGNRHVGRQMKGIAKKTNEESAQLKDFKDQEVMPSVTESDEITNRYQQLKEAQKAAVAVEDYEEAARIRDQIKELEQTMLKGGREQDD